MIKWLTQAEAKKAAKTSRKEALIFSFLHWQQLAQATPRDIIDADRNWSGWEMYMSSKTCAMCIRYQEDERLLCNKCRLACQTKGKWWKAHFSFRTYRRALWNKLPFEIEDAWRQWRRAANVLLAHIRRRLWAEYGIDGRSLRKRIS